LEGITTFSVDLIKQLDEQYPNRQPNITDTERQVWFKAGQRSVVDNLIFRQKCDEERKYEIKGDS
jgi:hypothetical protein